VSQKTQETSSQKIHAQKKEKGLLFLLIIIVVLVFSVSYCSLN